MATPMVSHQAHVGRLSAGVAVVARSCAQGLPSGHHNGPGRLPSARVFRGLIPWRPRPDGGTVMTRRA